MAAREEYCVSTNCGDQEIRYPFWLQNTTTTAISTTGQPYCGYQGLGLQCFQNSNNFTSTFPEKNPLLLHLSGFKYFVKTIDYSGRRLSLIDCDVTLNQTCPRAFHNLTLEDSLLLRFSGLDDWNLTFYFNCTGSLPDSDTIRTIDCLRSGGNMSYVSLEAENEFEWFVGFCEQKVVATVMRENVYGGLIPNWPSVSGGALTQGFSVDWLPDDECGRCEMSKGRCGFNSSGNQFLCFCKDTIRRDECQAGSNVKFILKFGIGLGATATALTGLICIVFFVLKRKRYEKNINIEASLKVHYGSLALKRYSYSNIKKMTLSFKEKLGQGGYGTVYKGKLLDGRLVAVKLLNVSKENGEEFLNEVLSISKTSHVNIVMLVGFCLEGKKRALVYEYMPNGSLEKYIYCKKDDANYKDLGMDKLYQISLGVARGLEYLHRGCNTRILHFDIKPHNILLDEDFSPRISDFGLSRQYTNKESDVSILGPRGTIGYIAPELVSRSFGCISYKSDVYSYGMMIMEIVGQRKNVRTETSHTSEVYFPQWAYQHLIIDKDLRLKSVATQEEDEIARKIIMVGFWCIQNDPSQRPSMSKVIEMLEGKMQAIPIPPKTFFGSPSTTPRSSLSTSSSSIVAL